MNTQPENGARPDSAEERRARIAQLVRERGSIRVVDLVEPLGVSEPTLRKDLTILENDGLLKRTHGGAITLELTDPAKTAETGVSAVPGGPVVPAGSVPSRPRVPAHQGAGTGAEDRVARLCLEMISDDASAFFDSGFTILKMAELMDQPANILTNSLPVVPVLADKPRIRHTLLGGQYRPLGKCVTGPIAMMGLRQFTVDTAFISVVGVNANGGYVTDVSEADIKRAAIDSARRVVVPLASTKVGQVGFCHLVSLDRIDDIVTDSPNAELQQWCNTSGVRLHIAN